ncbi:hypothetical protein BDD14_2977 [Edaphobacter modestus]|uniref:Uncharacterized protein n=1 Tax=Edaphobacter modestus TaxID=388466 RepID=A0A4Q7YVR5_9BACT|nr:hypothetical protein BDD14_2977 [Edaphobacter modestus]
MLSLKFANLYRSSCVAGKIQGSFKQMACSFVFHILDAQIFHNIGVGLPEFGKKTLV